jgi:hypothetical protein
MVKLIKIFFSFKEGKSVLQLGAVQKIRQHLGVGVWSKMLTFTDVGGGCDLFFWGGKKGRIKNTDIWKVCTFLPTHLYFLSSSIQNEASELF